MDEAQNNRNDAHPRRPQSRVGGDEPAEDDKRHRCNDGGRACRRERQAEETAREPCRWQRKEREAPCHRAPQARKERQGQCGKEVFGGERKVRDAVVERPETGVDEVRLRDHRYQRERRHGARANNESARHASACHRKTAPDVATPAPAARRTACPQFQRWIVPMPMPAACSRPVATTKPML